MDEITELKKTIAEQQQKIAALEKIIALIPCNIYWKNREGQYLGCSDSNLKIIGFTRKEDFVGKTIHALLDKQFADTINQTDEEIMSSGTEKVLEENWIDIHGQPAIYQTHKIPLLDEQQQVIGLLGISLDITSRKKMELELKEAKKFAEQQHKISQLYLNNIVSYLPENFYWVDRESRVLDCNENQAKAVGLSRMDLIGKDNYDIAEILGWDKKLADAVRKNDLEIIETKQSKKIEETVLLNGEKRTFLSYKNPMLDEQGNVLGVFGVGIDITERKRVEEELLLAKQKAEIANQAKSQFMMNISHDIRTPFSGILGFSELLYKNEADPQKKEMLSYIIQSSKGLLNLLNEILELTSNVTNVCAAAMDFSIKDSIYSVINLLLAEIKYKNLEFSLNFSETIPLHLYGNKFKFEKILLNLLSNAVKFTEKGSIKINLEAQQKTQTDLTLQLIVEDSGIGIPSDQHETIFECFSRLTPSYVGKYQGSGLGLYIVKQYIEEMNGKISVSSELNVGSRFTCHIPFKISSPSVSEIANTNTMNNHIRYHSYNLALKIKKYVLLVEDDLISQKISKVLLQEYFNCDVDIAAHGQMALEMTNKNQYDLILMDIGLPNIDGFTLTKKIRALGNSYSQIPILGLTAHADDSYQEKAFTMGMNALLQKPLSEELCLKIFSSF